MAHGPTTLALCRIGCGLGACTAVQGAKPAGHGPRPTLGPVGCGGDRGTPPCASRRLISALERPSPAAMDGRHQRPAQEFRLGCGRLSPGGSMGQRARPVVAAPCLYQGPRPLAHRPTRRRTAATRLKSLSRPPVPPIRLEMAALGPKSADVRHKAASPGPHRSPPALGGAGAVPRPSGAVQAPTTIPVGPTTPPRLVALMRAGGVRERPRVFRGVM